VPSVAPGMPVTTGQRRCACTGRSTSLATSSRRLRKDAGWWVRRCMPKAAFAELPLWELTEVSVTVDSIEARSAAIADLPQLTHESGIAIGLGIAGQGGVGRRAQQLDWLR
jgi:ribonuclease HIII